MGRPHSIVVLPRDISAESHGPQEDIIVYEYVARAGSLRGKSILAKNAVSLVLNGRKTMHFASKTVHVQADEVHFLSSGHCVASMDLLPGEPFRSILVFFDDDVLLDFLLKYDPLIRHARKRTESAHEAYVSFKKDSFLRAYISSLQSLLRGNSRLSREMKLVKLEELMLHLVETQPETFLSFRFSSRGELGDFELRRAVEANVTSNLSLEELAFLCNSSVSTFKRRFARIYGMSPNRWIRQRRMEMAAFLIQQRGERPSEVFHKVGYESHSSFSESFKKAFGVTPRRYGSENRTYSDSF